MLPRTEHLFLGSFFTLDTQATTPGQLRAQVHLNTHHPVFGGHFPSQPIVPGVGVLTMLKDTLQQHLRVQLLLSACTSVKYLHPIDPLRMATLEMEITYTVRQVLLEFQASVLHRQLPLCRLAGCFQLVTAPLPATLSPSTSPYVLDC